MRLIDADAFDKDLLGAEIEATKSRKYVFSSAINTIRGNLANFPTVNQWIPCSERLPEEGTEVLGTDDHGCIRHVVKDKSALYEFATYEEMMHINIVAWQPLPEPYKEEKNDKSRYL